MKPIGQTFFVDEPATGVPGVFITKIDVYFKKVSSQYGIELQIRTTDNNVPTTERLPFASKILNVYNDDGTLSATRPRASDNASIPTTFEFDTPVFVQSGKSYAFVLIPLGGNPDYQVWTGEISRNDVSTGIPIYVNNETGDLFLSSNDRSWTPVINEDIKFTIYTANFTSSTGTAVFTSPNEDYLSIKDIVGNFFEGEQVYVANQPLNISILNVSSVQGSFSNGHVVYQSNGIANTATGTVYAANSSVIKLANTRGSFNTSNTLFNSNVTANATVISVSKNCVTSNTSNTITVPDSSVFAVNDAIYVSTSNYSRMYIAKVTNIVNATAIRTTGDIVSPSNTSSNWLIPFTENAAVVGKLAYNGLLTGGFGTLYSFKNYNYCILDFVSSNSSMNFSNAIGGKIVGISSGASATVLNTVDVKYNQFSPQIPNIAPSNTDLSWSFRGYRNSAGFPQDSSFIKIKEGVSNEFNDYERAFMSRSNEFNQISGNRSLTLNAVLSTSNNKISPVVDTISKIGHFTYNLCAPALDLEGYYISLPDNENFKLGNTISQGNTTGLIRFANSTFLRVVNATGVFNTSSNIALLSTPSINVTPRSVEYYSETQDNGFDLTSRYISKNVVLADTQYSEDLIAFIAAYRPISADVLVYAKIINNEDNETFDSKNWSAMLESGGSRLYSSQYDLNDFIELKYELPRSVLLSNSATVVSNLSNTVTLDSTANLAIGDMIYVSATFVPNTFNVTANTAGVSNTAETINISNANTYMLPGDRVFYTVPNGNTAIGGLTGNSFYYISFSNASSIALTNTLGGSNINITESKTTAGEIHTISTLESGEKFNVREIMSITNSTAVVVDTPTSFNSTNAAVGYIPGLQSRTGAFLYADNNYIVRYVTNDDLVFESFSQFAIKLVPVSNNTALVPRIADMRALALQI